MKRRDYKLVRDGKYNRTAIMQQAWAYVRMCNYSYENALQEAWNHARQKMKLIRWQERKQLTVNNNAPAENKTKQYPASNFGYNRGQHAGLFTGWNYNYTGD